MNTITRLVHPLVSNLFVLISCVTAALAQEISIPDPGLNAAVRSALQKPNGPLTEQDLLNLTDLDACCRNIRDLQGLDAARNLTLLDLQSNRLAKVSFPAALTNLNYVDLSFNPLTNCIFPGSLAELSGINIEGSELASLTLPAGLRRLAVLSLHGNRLTSLNLPTDLTGLDFLDVSGNAFTNLNLPSGLNRVTVLAAWGNRLTSLTLPTDMTNLLLLDLFFNQLTNVTLPANLRTLGTLDLDGNNFSQFALPPNLIRLVHLNFRDNQLTNVTLLAGMTNLTFLDLESNQLSDFTLPPGAIRLNFLRLSSNKLTSLTLPRGLTNLATVFLRFNQLTNLTLPRDLTNLVQIDVKENQLASLTLPPDATKLSALFLEGNPLTALVLSEPMAATTLAPVVAALQNQGVSVFTYPLTIQLVRPRKLTGAFQLGISGPPGLYTVLGSTNLTNWNEVGVASNTLGAVSFNDVTGNLSPRKFYRALQQSPPANMVFIAPNTFTMGGPTNELHRDTNEGPQTTVTLTHGFWIGRYEVTQGEYLSVTGTNPSQFPGDLRRPISSVSWPDATNYCWRLTQREQANGQISPDSQYRLPTEAEWECAARAGTATRFSYGNDPDYANLTNYAWQSFDDGLTVHPVGQKLPNPWGLYDMMGNVFEWCQDWLGPLPGGAVVDPTGADANPIGWKIMRGGTFDFGGAACRSASRMFFPSHPALTDWDLGFRVVLVTGQQQVPRSSARDKETASTPPALGTVRSLTLCTESGRCLARNFNS